MLYFGKTQKRKLTKVNEFNINVAAGTNTVTGIFPLVGDYWAVQVLCTQAINGASTGISILTGTSSNPLNFEAFQSCFSFTATGPDIQMRLFISNKLSGGDNPKQPGLSSISQGSADGFESFNNGNPSGFFGLFSQAKTIYPNYDNQQIGSGFNLVAQSKQVAFGATHMAIGFGSPSGGSNLLGVCKVYSFD